ncbi:hypothetical protein BGLT_03708 [Caballeronia glathei]|uniref:DUF2934 domain-containing protein n=1 Tax=Caballeronia glathei TaxID=60547 RepID=UPI0005088FA8|nr:DUF2934 domain-containing protein [Caballeronia glathei]CDY74766.1 hypothetical protein BGLT_03708 [Caballeronia glathei]
MENTSLDTSTDEQIRRKAYELWEEAGSPEGRADEFWEEARASVAGENGGPASVEKS